MSSITLSGDVVMVARCKRLFSHVMRVSASCSLIFRILFHLVIWSSWAEVDLEFFDSGAVCDLLFFPS